MSDSPPGPDVRERLAHEIRNSAGAIRTAAELLQRRFQPEGRDLRLFEVIFTEVERLKDVMK